MKTIIIRANDDVMEGDDVTKKYVDITDGQLSLEEKQEIVGGYIEYVPYVRGLSFPTLHGENAGSGFTIKSVIVNEEGLMRDLPVNFDLSVIINQRIVGDAIVEVE